MSDDVPRQHPRFALEVDIELKTPRGTAAGRTRNLSQGGFCAVVEGEVTKGDLVTVHVSLVFTDDAVSEPLTLTAKVCWSTAIGGGRRQIGCSFSDLPHADEDYLEMFLRYLQEGPPGEDEGQRDDPDDLFFD